MNFGITKIKIILTVIISLIGGFILSQSAGWFGCFDCSADMLMKSYLMGMSVAFLTFFIPIYIIWSFFDKRESSKIGKYIGWLITSVFILIILILLFLFIYQQIKYPNIY